MLRHGSSPALSVVRARPAVGALVPLWRAGGGGRPRTSRAAAAAAACPRPTSLPWTSTRRRFSSTAGAPSSSVGQAQSTIFALATPPGKAGVAVFRVSGPAVQAVHDLMVFPVGSSSGGGASALRQLAQGRTLPPARRMVMRDICVPSADGTTLGEVIDEGLVVYFEAGKSFTNEPMLELHLHSSPAIASLVLSSLGRLPALRPADRGEFTRRAFLSGRLDLTEVEGLRDLLESETELQRKLARHGMAGAAKLRFDGIRERVVGAMAQADALIDFGEDDAIGDEAFQTAQDQVALLIAEIRAHLADARRGEIVREGVKVSIFGPPNAGKSSLLNFLSRRDVAIVSPVPGTTRDVVTVSLDLDGIKAVVSDTAGLRATAADEVEEIGIARAAAAVSSADLKVLVLPLPPFAYPWTDARALLEEDLVLPLVDQHTVVLFNQADLLPPAFGPGVDGLDGESDDEERGRRLAQAVVERWLPKGTRWWVASVETGFGMDAFLEAGLHAAVKQTALADTAAAGTAELPLIASARQKYHLERALSHLLDFTQRKAPDVVLASEALRRAAFEIGAVSGRQVAPDDVLDRLFGDFCIGK